MINWDIHRTACERTYLNAMNEMQILTYTIFLYGLSSVHVK